MFTYIDRDSYLNRLNPTVKLFLIIVLTIVVSLSLYPVLPLFTIGAVIGCGCVLGEIPFGEMLRKASLFIGIGVTFAVFMLILKGIDNPGADLHFFIFSWNPQDLIHALSLGARIIAFSLMAVVFVTTTSPNDLVLSLILQLKVPYVHGYAALAAYRFLPTLQTETRNIRLAQEIRGMEWGRGPVGRITSPFRMLLPLLCTAARRGERVALAMDSRGLGMSRKRTFYKKTQVTGQDLRFVSRTVLVYGVLTVLLIYLDMFHFSFGF